jgi:hypothetical protein
MHQLRCEPIAIHLLRIPFSHNRIDRPVYHYKILETLILHRVITPFPQITSLLLVLPISPLRPICTDLECHRLRPPLLEMYLTLSNCLLSSTTPLSAMESPPLVSIDTDWNTTHLIEGGVWLLKQSLNLSNTTVSPSRLRSRSSCRSLSLSVYFRRSLATSYLYQTSHKRFGIYIAATSYSLDTNRMLYRCTDYL